MRIAWGEGEREQRERRSRARTLSPRFRSHVPPPPPPRTPTASPFHPPYASAIFPDAGSAALLKQSWGPDPLPFGLASLNDRLPIQPSDGAAVMCAPDPQGLADAQRIAASCELPLVIFNGRLASGDAGIGLNVRRMRERFLGTFAVAYSIRPLPGGGSIFYRYPGPWKVFLEDQTAPGRYQLAAVRPRRPAGDELDDLLISIEAGGAKGGK